MIQTTRVLNAEVEQREDFGQAEEYFLEILSGPCSIFLHHLTYGAVRSARYIPEATSQLPAEFSGGICFRVCKGGDGFFRLRMQPPPRRGAIAVPPFRLWALPSSAAMVFAAPVAVVRGEAR
jgi:hypothetical protein